MVKIDWTSTDNTSKYGMITHHYLTDKSMLDKSEVNSVFVIAFDKDMNIYAVKRGDGRCGCAGGGVEEDKDATIIDTAIREVKEEIGVSLSRESLKVVRNINSIPEKNSFSKPCMVIMVGLVELIDSDEVYEPHGAQGRYIFNSEKEFLEHYDTGDKASMIKMLSEAKNLLFTPQNPMQNFSNKLNI